MSAPAVPRGLCSTDTDLDTLGVLKLFRKLVRVVIRHYPAIVYHKHTSADGAHLGKNVGTQQQRVFPPKVAY